MFHKVVEYFKINIRLVCLYLKKIAENTEPYLKSIENDNFQYIEDLDAAKDFAFYELFDMIYLIMGQYPRQLSFFKDNE